VRDLGITALFVTHDQEEAFDLSDRIAVMSAGRLRQFDVPRELYERPADRFVAGFVGRVNELPVVVEGDAVVLPGGVRWKRPTGGAEGSSPPERGDALLLLRPEDLVMVPPDQGAANAPPLPGTVTDRRFAGPVTTWRVRVDGIGSPLEVSAASDRVREGFQPAPGEAVGLVVRRPGLGMLFEATRGPDGARP
jgi:ABC-type Fe3+/spermidine/putrescine transport system ATPase subunit